MNFRKNGILLILASDFFFGFLAISVKWANHLGYSALETAFFRFLFALTGVGLIVVTRLGGLAIVNRKAVFWRGFFGGWSVFFFFVTLQYTTAAKATLFNYTYSIWANVFDVAFLKRKPPKGFILSLLLALLGTWLVLGVQWGRWEWGDLPGMLSGMAAGAAVLAVKEARRTDNALTVFTSFSLFGFLIAGFFLLAGVFWTGLDWMGWKAVDGKGWEALVVMGLIAMAAQLLFTQGYGYASLAVGTLLSLLVPVLTAFFGWALLGESLTSHFMLGTILILTACALIGKSEEAIEV